LGAKGMSEKLSDQIMAILENIKQNKLFEAKLDLCVLWGTAKINEALDELKTSTSKQLDAFEKTAKNVSNRA